jgi:hypothetical protein
VGEAVHAAQKLPLVPDSIRPYDLRHSFGTLGYAETGDIRATQELLGHSRIELTERYALAAIMPWAVAAVAKMGTAIGPTRTGRTLPFSDEDGYLSPTAMRSPVAVPAISATRASDGS